MAVTTVSHDQALAGVSTTKLVFIFGAFLVLLTLFVTQTEFTSQAYQRGFSEPIVLLFVTHGMWWILWPIQAVATAVWRTGQKWRSLARSVHIPTALGMAPTMTLSQYERLPLELQPDQGDEVELQVAAPNLWVYFKKCIVKQLHNVYHTAVLVYEGYHGNTQTENLQQLIDKNPRLLLLLLVIACVRLMAATPAIKYICWKLFLITIVLTLAGCTWYAAMLITYALNVTAIYNCLAFTAYAFAIPMLNEKFSWVKVSSVVIAVGGVFVVSYSGEEDAAASDYPYAMWGNLLILVGAVLYGYYECLYKKYACVPAHLAPLITPRRQLTFANFIMMLFGAYTFVILAVAMLIADLLGFHHFNFFNYGEKTGMLWGLVSGLIVLNLLFSGLFLLLMALTLPVLSLVSSLLTIFIIGVVEWWLFDNALGAQQLFGDFLIIVGFVILTWALWKEISEGKEDSDDVDAISTYSFAVSTDDR